MPEIIDVIGPSNALCPSFTVNNAFASIPLAFPAGPFICKNAFGQSVLSKGDSLRVLSVGVILPENFTFYHKTPMDPFLRFIFYPVGNVSGHTFFNPNFQQGNQFIPLENYEMIFDTFLSCRETIDSVDPTKTLIDEDFKLVLNLYSNYEVSMLGVPSTLNGITFQVRMFAKILHNFVMS